MEAKIERPAAILDRDGTIIVDTGFPDNPDRIEILPGAVEGIRMLNEGHVPVVVISNQSGVARGFFGIETVEAVNKRLAEMLEARGARIDAFFYCPHHPSGIVEKYRLDCDCRKPKPGLAMKAARQLGFDLSASFVVGDKSSDLEFARNIGGHSILIRTGLGAETEKSGNFDVVFDTLSSAADYILSRLNKN